MKEVYLENLFAKSWKEVIMENLLLEIFQLYGAWLCAIINYCIYFQVTLYSEKFDEFQNSLNKSNEMFNTFRKEMDKVRNLK